METQHLPFDPPPTGEQLKRAGMERAAANRTEQLEQARAIARQIATEGDGTCDMDQVRQRLPDDIDLGPAAGSLFLRSDWMDTGQRRRSTLPSNHARELRVWRLK